MSLARNVLLCSFNFALAVLIACSATGFLLAASPQQPKAAQAPAHPTQFRVVKIVCGAKGISRGTEFEMQDARRVFHVPEDHEIIIYFEWEGPPGTHHAEGEWRSPNGKVVLNSDFDLVSESTHYRGTWRLAIPETIATGLWALEAQIDGQPAGTQTFEIISTKTAAPVPPPMPTPAEVYQRAAPATVFVTSLDESGDAITRGFAFFIDKGALLTAFQVLDGATSLRVDFADGSNVIVSNVVAWNRRQDWAILKIDSANVQPLEKAAPNSWKIGDLCYVLMSQGQGSRTIQNVNITGLQGIAGATQRVNLSWYGVGISVGAPVLDGYGRVIGVLGGGLSWMGSRRMGGFTGYLEPGPAGGPTFADPTVLPISSIPEAAMSQQPVTLGEMATRGVLMMPLVRDSQVATASLCEDFQNIARQAFLPVRPKREFSKRLGVFALVATWGPNEKLKGSQQLRLYNTDNQPVLQSAASTIDLTPRVTAFSAWKVPITSLEPGIYRVDLTVNDRPQWREFFRVSQ
ncbi:MAG TPA: serine protease [Candidatus Limnocylindria bacterium]|nr:serine protease [Candidatus Limnocylindria bacterium]